MGRFGRMLVAAMVAASPAVAADYQRLHYELLVVENCGLLGKEVEAGFVLARDDSLRAQPLDLDQRKAARVAASIAFDEEWSNRGLGGARQWCREEGKTAALAFFARYIDDRFTMPGNRPPPVEAGP
ncbi:MAG: hypothetical protein U1E45_10195 [Geminicoccaceae bacterium]